MMPRLRHTKNLLLCLPPRLQRQLPTTPDLVEDHLSSENVHNQLAAVGCRCGRGDAKNKQERTFCRVYKDGCRCFQTIKGCLSTCGFLTVETLMVSDL